jgi:allantoinase
MKRFGLRSTRVVYEGKVQPAVVVVDGEHIEAVVHTREERTLGDLTITDMGSSVVMAGLVDTHVHINEPGRTEWEGFATATRAAAAGGVTTVVDMPLNCSPVTTSVGALAIKLRAAAPALWVDTGFWGGVVPDNAGELASLAAAGVLGCKAFLCDSGIDDFPAVDEAALRRAMRALAQARVPLLAHAELDLGAPTTHDARVYASYLASRPGAWEEAAIALLIRLVRETGCAVHIVHLSAASALPALAAARRERLPITVETCPHYLTLAAEDIADGQTQFKCAPPIRERANREALWQGLEDGIIDMVTTDHSPCTPALKRPDVGDFHAAWGGISSLQLGLPVVWTSARQRGFTLPDMARWMSEAPARVSGLYPQKGRLSAGADADLVVWDPEADLTVEAEQLHVRHKLTPYLGQHLVGSVRATYLRGSRIFSEGTHRQLARGVALLHRSSQENTP